MLCFEVIYGSCSGAECLAGCTTSSVRLRWAAPLAIQSMDCDKGWLAGQYIYIYIYIYFYKLVCNTTLLGTGLTWLKSYLCKSERRPGKFMPDYNSLNTSLCDNYSFINFKWTWFNIASFLPMDISFKTYFYLTVKAKQLLISYYYNMTVIIIIITIIVFCLAAGCWWSSAEH